MLVREIFESARDEESALVTRIVAITNQLKQDLEDGKIPAEGYTVDDLLDYFQAYDVILDVTDLYTMIENPPLKSVVSNIQGQDVVFKGHSGEEVEAPEGESKEVVAQMAKRAMNN